jgi:hypothetical protein
MTTYYSKPDNALTDRAPALSFAPWFASSSAFCPQSLSVAWKPWLAGFRVARRVPFNVSQRCRPLERVVAAVWNRCCRVFSREGLQPLQSRLTLSQNTLFSPVVYRRQPEPGLSANSQFAPRLNRTLDRCMAQFITSHVALCQLTDESAPGSRKNHNHMRKAASAQTGPVGRQERMNHYEENNVNQRVAIRREPDRDCRR